MTFHNPTLARCVTTADMMCARDRRAAAQQQLLSLHKLPLVSFTLNIPGPVKRTALAELAFNSGLRILDEALGTPVDKRIVRAHTGCEALLVYRHTASRLKKVCLQIEGNRPVGRLYDLDVLEADGTKLSRTTPRTCLLCGAPVTACARSRAHGLDALCSAVEALLREHATEELAACAFAALVEEAELTPKPGLVDRHNNGAHDDMDLPLFRRSAAALHPHLRHIAALGMANAAPSALQEAGLEAERAMFAATGGVNTHKGALYSFSLLLAAAGHCLCAGGDLFETVRRLAEQLQPPRQTHGVQVLQQYQVGGARAEALAGFPTAQRAASLLTDNDPLTVLLWLMAHVEDSNVYYRGGANAAAMVHRSAAAILEAPSAQRISLTAALDEQLIAHRISPGGCADLLALALLLQRLHSLIA